MSGMTPDQARKDVTRALDELMQKAGGAGSPRGVYISTKKKRLVDMGADFVFNGPNAFPDFPNLRPECFTAAKFIDAVKNAIEDDYLESILVDLPLEKSEKYREILTMIAQKDPEIPSMETAQQALITFKEQYALTDFDIDYGSQFISRGPEAMYGLVASSDPCFDAETVARMLQKTKEENVEWHRLEEFYAYVKQNSTGQSKAVWTI